MFSLWNIYIITILLLYIFSNNLNLGYLKKYKEQTKINNNNINNNSPRNFLIKVINTIIKLKV